MTTKANLNTSKTQAVKAFTKNTKGFKTSDRRDNGFYKSFLYIYPETIYLKTPTGTKKSVELKEIIDLRLYCPGTMHYACFWFNAGDYASGSGRAGGYGYDKGSAAAGAAIAAAGYELSRSISGVGEAAIVEAIEAIAAYHGYTGGKVFIAHE